MKDEAPPNGALRPARRRRSEVARGRRAMPAPPRPFTAFMVALLAAGASLAGASGIPGIHGLLWRLQVDRRCLGELRRRARARPADDVPFVTIAFAQSLNGCITKVESGPTAISSPASQILTHAIRSQHDAVLIGGRTAEVDDPRLTVRRWRCRRQPRSVVLDTSGRRLPGTQRMEDVLHVVGSAAAAEAATQRFRAGRGAYASVVVEERDGVIPPVALLKELRRRGVRSVMVEGGGRVISSFLEAGAFDLVCVTVAPRVMSGYAVPVPKGFDEHLSLVAVLRPPDAASGEGDLTLVFGRKGGRSAAAGDKGGRGAEGGAARRV